VIGISTFVEKADWGRGSQPAAFVPHNYVSAVSDAGGRAVLLPPDALDADVVSRLDALIIAGGADVAPERYAAAPHERTYTRPDRDASEFLLLAAARERDLPVLGICRGMQLMAVASGGTLIQHLPDVVGHTEHEHAVSVEPGSLLSKILGERIDVNSFHHQGVNDPGTLVATARSDDGLIEALEDPTRRFTLGVQWHPEAMDQAALFLALTDAARDR